MSNNYFKAISITKINLFFLCACISFTIACGQIKSNNDSIIQVNMVNELKNNKMKVEVWSDIMCPFCYIGKRNYEAALSKFADSNDIEIEWHSFQLDPAIKNSVGKKEDLIQYLATRKGISYEQSAQMHDNVVQMAKASGLHYNFDIAIMANSFDAHRMIQMAKTKGLGDEAEEILFKAYFTQGKDFGNHQTLIDLGKEIGLSEEDVNTSLNNETYSSLVRNDINEADSLGISGVPFFLFNRKIAISGAQPSSVFLETLRKSHQEWKKQNINLELEIKEGTVCKPNKECK